MPPFLKNLRIPNKLMLILLIFLIVMVTGSIYILNKEKGYRTQLTLEKAIRISRFLSKISSVFMQTFDYQTISDFIKEVKTDKDFTYIVISDTLGHTLPISAEDLKIKKTLDNKRLRNIREIKTPILFLEEKIGDIETGTSLERINKQINISMLNIGFLLTVFGVLSTIIILFISRTIAQPIANLMEGVKRISSGDLDYRIQVYSEDETGELSRAFNSMSESLKQAYKQLQEYSRGLEVKVEERTAQLQQVNAELTEINKELDEFTYIVSHDLQEPLRSIDAFSKFVYEDYKDKLTEEAKNYLERVRANAFRMKELIEDLLELSRLGRIQNPFEEIDVKVLLEPILERFTYTINEKNAEVIIKEPLPCVYCDKLRLGEVFANLIGNALKFSQNKERPKVEIGGYQEGEFYCFYVKDNGIGIDKQYFEKIFGIFQRLHTIDKYPGTGAGLAICKKIIELHQGKIWLESEPGKGSTFYFALPKDKHYYQRRKENKTL